jgi:hypothetical protein
MFALDQQSNVHFGRTSLKKSLDRSLRVGADALRRKTPYFACAVIRIASGRRGIERDGGDELCQRPQILGGRGKQEFIARAAWSSPPQSSEPPNPLEMRKPHFEALAFPCRLRERWRAAQSAGDISCVFMNASQYLASRRLGATMSLCSHGLQSKLRPR